MQYCMKALCVTYLISVSEQMLTSTPTKLTHSCTTPSSAAFRAPADTSCLKNKIKENNYKDGQKMSNTNKGKHLLLFFTDK